MISILLPTYNGELFLENVINNILNQTFKDFELIICDDFSSDNTINILKKFNDTRIKLQINSYNIGFPGNIRKCYDNSKYDIIVTLCQDDEIPATLLENYMNIFVNHKNVGAISRNYFLRDKSNNQPFRIWKFNNIKKDYIILDKYSKKDELNNFFKTLDNMTALAFRRLKFNPFHEKDLWTSHVYPFIYHLSLNKLMLVNHYMFSGTIHENQSRLKKAYLRSPMDEWIDLTKKMDEIGLGDLGNFFRKNFISKNYVGLIQIKLFSNYKSVLYEIFNLISLNKMNLLNFKFYFYALICLCLNKKTVELMSDYYKFKILKKKINSYQTDAIKIFSEKLDTM